MSVRIEKKITTQSGTNMHSPRIANLVERRRSVVATIGKTLTMLMPMQDNKKMPYCIQNAESVKGRFLIFAAKRAAANPNAIMPVAISMSRIDSR